MGHPGVVAVTDRCGAWIRSSERALWRVAGWLDVALGEGFVGRGGGPAGDDEEDIEDEERDGEVVVEVGARGAGPELIGGPEQEGDGEQRGLEELGRAGAADGLIDEIGDGDEGERQCAQKIMRAGGEERGDCVPDEQDGHSDESEDTEKQWGGAVGAVKMRLHLSTVAIGRHRRVVQAAGQRRIGGGQEEGPSLPGRALLVVGWMREVAYFLPQKSGDEGSQESGT